MHKADLIIIGAGPAGMSAASCAAETGLSVLILDEQRAAGGQIYRDVERVTPLRGDILGADYRDGLSLTNELTNSNITHVNDAVVWQVEEGPRVHFTKNGVAASATAKHLLVATGALERPMPVPGWTLPGVMTAGAGQILLKQSGMVAQGAILIGSGPLLYLLAAQMVRTGEPPKAIIETQTRSNMLGAMRHIGGALRGYPYLIKGLGLLFEIVKAGVPRYTGAANIKIEGTKFVEAVSFDAAGESRTLECQNVMMHHGVVPNTQVLRSMEIEHRWLKAQECFVPTCDEWGRTSIPTIFIAGDGAGIGGAKAAAAEGALSALDIAREHEFLSLAERDKKARKYQRKLNSELAARPFIDAAYPPYGAALLPADATIVCRCEEVTAGQIRKFAKQGCLGPNQMKAFCRAGMGPCQGRYCGLTVNAILSDAHDQAPDETGHYRIRAPLKPITLGEIATLDEPGHSGSK